MQKKIVEKTWTMQSFIDIYKIAYHYIKCNFTMFPADSIPSDRMQQYH